MKTKGIFSFFLACVILNYMVSACSAVAMPENVLYGKLITLTINPPSLTVQREAERITKLWNSEKTQFKDVNGNPVSPNTFSVKFGGKEIGMAFDGSGIAIRIFAVTP